MSARVLCEVNFRLFDTKVCTERFPRYFFVKMYIFLGRFEIPPRLGPRRLPPRSPGGGGQGRGDGGEVHRAKLPVQFRGQVFYSPRNMKNE